MFMVKSEYVVGIDYFFVVYVGFDYLMGEVVVGIEKLFVMCYIDVEIEGMIVYVGKVLEVGVNVIYVFGMVIESVYGIL